MGAQAAEQFDRFQKIRLSNAVRADDQQPRLVQLQLQRRVVPEPLQMELLEPDGSGSDLWVRYLEWSGYLVVLLLRLRPFSGHVAQLDRASDSGSEGRGFESLHARKMIFKVYIPLL